MSKAYHQFLSEIHGLVSRYHAEMESLCAEARQRGAHEILAVLGDLSNLRASKKDRGSVASRRSNRPTVLSEGNISRSPSRGLSVGRMDLTEAIRHMLLSAESNRTIAELIALAETVLPQLKFNRKHSKQRIVSKIIANLRKKPEEEQRAFALLLSESGGKTFVSDWSSAIKNSRSARRESDQSR